MKKLTCPNCKETITLDRKELDLLKNEIQNDEFKKELDKRIFELRKKFKAKEIENSLEKEKELSNSKKIICQLKDKLAEQEIQKNKFEQMNENLECCKIIISALSFRTDENNLEIFCRKEFETIRPLLQNSSFTKIKETSNESKGNYIFRASQGGVEYCSIFFEIRNEMDNTHPGLKNGSFLDELDKNRKRNNCEYAVLVSILENENEFYWSGIASLSHKYEKMYAIRPQFFTKFLTLLVETSMNTLEYKKSIQKIFSLPANLTLLKEAINNEKVLPQQQVQRPQMISIETVNDINHLISQLKILKGSLLNNQITNS